MRQHLLGTVRGLCAVDALLAPCEALWMLSGTPPFCICSLPASNSAITVTAAQELSIYTGGKQSWKYAMLLASSRLHLKTDIDKTKDW